MRLPWFGLFDGMLGYRPSAGAFGFICGSENRDIYVA
jgi:hypothetical protein